MGFCGVLRGLRRAVLLLEVKFWGLSSRAKLFTCLLAKNLSRKLSFLYCSSLNYKWVTMCLPHVLTWPWPICVFLWGPKCKDMAPEAGSGSFCVTPETRKVAGFLFSLVSVNHYF